MRYYLTVLGIVIAELDTEDPDRVPSIPVAITISQDIADQHTDNRILVSLVKVVEEQDEAPRCVTLRTESRYAADVVPHSEHYYRINLSHKEPIYDAPYLRFSTQPSSAGEGL